MRSQTEAIRREYRFLAAWYDRIWSRYIRRSIALTLPRLPVKSRLRILDVGCGTGLLLDKLSRRDPTAALVGIDLTLAMLATARRRTLGRAEVVGVDASMLPFPRDTFDVIVSTSVLHYLHAPIGPTLDRWRCCLRPEGSVVITDWCRDYVSIRLLDRFLRTVDPAHGRALTVSELRSALIETGYTHVDVTRHRLGWFWGMMVASAVVPLE